MPRRAKYDEEVLPLKYGVFSANFLLWSLAVGLFGVCISIRSDSGLWAYADNMDIYRYYQASYICLTVCALIFIVSILGCAGASKESEIMIFVYCVVAIILIIMEIAAAVLVWKIPGGDSLQYSLSNEFKWHMEQRLYNSKSRQFLDLIQLKLECCGAQTMLDYRNMYQDIPASCNNPRTNNINIRSCSEMLRRYLEIRGGAIGGIICSIILVKIAALCFSFKLMFDTKEQKEYDKEYRR